MDTATIRYRSKYGESTEKVEGDSIYTRDGFLHIETRADDGHTETRLIPSDLIREAYIRRPAQLPIIPTRDRRPPPSRTTPRDLMGVAAARTGVPMWADGPGFSATGPDGKVVGICGVYYGKGGGEGGAICRRSPGHPTFAEDGIGHAETGERDAP